ncbi:hypothetical protein J5N97_007159 [Dioscorea zingiberensis]|uniref:Peroxidase n=1 Tax=Dioscorea zingiberensis TaxID=325984 RepID=A0A9D5HU78_9LILI|nr:hypothetical protein J5N97_007159 [Dioscorea zingiberensis]
MEFRRSILVAVMVFMVVGSGEGQLAENFYGFACPNVEAIVRQSVMNKISQTPITIAATLRLFFHDCFVEGCDASVMIASPNGDAEKDSPTNLSLAGDGFDTVIKAKQAVEAACPNVVSCADILAIAARDVVALIGGPAFNVELGRRDGLVSMASRVAGNLPGPTFDLNLLSSLFIKNNLSMIDMIALSGAHTIGFAHCSMFSDRLYSFNSSSHTDPSLDPSYAQQLKRVCPPYVDPTIVVGMDASTPTAFDNAYYKNLLHGKGLFTSDEVLFMDPISRPTVSDFASNSRDFFSAFAAAMVKLGRTGVKTGNDGEIRRDCTAFNSF